MGRTLHLALTFTSQTLPSEQPDDARFVSSLPAQRPEPRLAFFFLFHAERFSYKAYPKRRGGKASPVSARRKGEFLWLRSRMQRKSAR
jgi:hypothetical protein